MSLIADRASAPAWRDEFPLDPAITYLNHAAVAPWPRRSAVAVEAFAQENIRFGASHYDRWLRIEQGLRQQLASLINAASPHDIALQKNTSEGLSVIAYGLEWHPGDEILITDQEFPSNRIVWESLANKGVTTQAVDISGVDPEAAIIARMTPKTRLLSVSSVQFGTGLQLDLVRLGQHCRARNILFCVDAIQSLGAVPFDLATCQADFVVADGHKWMLGPEGIALFYVAPTVREQLTLHQFGWHMVEHAGDYTRTDWQPARSARRFECGSPNMLGCVALSASLSLLLETGLSGIHQQVLANTHYLITQLAALPGIDVITPVQRERHAGIVTFRSHKVSSDTLFSGLKTAGIICAPRGGGIRFSPHFHTQRASLDHALEVVARLTA